MVAFAGSFRARTGHLVVGGLLAAFGVAILVGAENGPTLCVFRRCTGGYCPGCGASRSAGALLRGDLGRAWHHHPWVVVAAAQVIAVSGLVVLGVGVARERLLRPLLLANVALGVTIWLVRLTLGLVPVPFG